MTSEKTMNTVDTGVVAATVAVFFKLLPDITALFALIYLVIRISETERFRQFWRFIRRK